MSSIHAFLGTATLVGDGARAVTALLLRVTG